MVQLQLIEGIDELGVDVQSAVAKSRTSSIFPFSIMPSSRARTARLHRIEIQAKAVLVDEAHELSRRDRLDCVEV